MHIHTWHLYAWYPWERGFVSKHLCRRCGKVCKTRYQWPEPRPARRAPAEGESVGSISGFLMGVGFATLVFAVAVLRGCVN